MFKTSDISYAHLKVMKDFQYGKRIAVVVMETLLVVPIIIYHHYNYNYYRTSKKKTKTFIIVGV